MKPKCEVENYTKLSYTELVNILCILAVRLERVEIFLGDLLKELSTQTEFQNHQVLKARMETMNDKTPTKRLKELEEQFAGMIQYVNAQFYAEKKPKRIKYE